MKRKLRTRATMMTRIATMMMTTTWKQTSMGILMPREMLTVMAKSTQMGMVEPMRRARDLGHSRNNHCDQDRDYDLERILVFPMILCLTSLHHSQLALILLPRRLA